MRSIAVDRVMANRELSCQDVHIGPWSSEVLPSVNDPLNSRDNDDNAKGSDAVIHAAARYGEVWREQEEHSGDRNVNKGDRVGNPANNIRKDKWALGEHVASAQAVDDNRHAIRNIKQYHRSGDNGVESTGRAKENASKDDHQCQIQIQRVQRNLQLGVHFAEEARSRKTSISCKSEDHTAACCHDGNGCKKHADQGEPRDY